MAGKNWIVGDRSAVAAELIYDAAAELIASDGLSAFDIDKLAARVHCSRATIYRYAGGKAKIRDVVIARAAARIVESVRAQAESLTGAERVVASVEFALAGVRSDPLGRHLVGSFPKSANGAEWFVGSKLVANFAADLAGITGGDHQAGGWLVRVVLSLILWPAEDAEIERQLVHRFIGPAFGHESGLDANNSRVAEAAS
ncbi:transcriptional regulatory protein [Mycobacterium marinum M]|uniref:Transcriptional regulatory protein n=2 Tax=Mycobacterium marinum TaxID=1781 RepID=B2HSS5_MYCMM|nr:TetR/AcrR family transcriptional regulator [Mycobacterium marinum]ACC41099.1 transcriptional regulatory protein [Mycobacterium marinum M]RFZ64673.1 Bacterial regulatory protein, tetR family [Mycobacterium marinum]